MIRKHILMFLCLSLCFACNKVENPADDGKNSDEVPSEIDDSVMRIVSFSFAKENNHSLKEDLLTEINGNIVSDGEGVDYYVNPGTMVASFELFAAKEVTDLELSIVFSGNEDPVVLKSGVTVADYMRPVTLRMTAGFKGKEISRDYSFRFHNLNTGLPVLYLFTPDGQAITSKEVWMKDCTIYLDAVGKQDADGTAFEEDYYGEKDNLRGRGNSTWNYAKKPYAVKLDKKASWLGMPKHKRWVLLANAIDRSMLRNRLAYEIADRCEGLEWTPHTRYVEVVLNGSHKGTYLCCEQIKADKNRVPVPSGNDMLDPSEGGGPDADPEEMGFLMEIDRYLRYEGSDLWWSSQRYNGSGTTTVINGDCVSWAADKSFHVNYGGGEPLKFNFGLKDPDDAELINSSSSQFCYIRDYVLQVEKEVLGSSHAMDKIDVDSFIDYWFVYELTLNHEPNNPGSCYMYKKPESDGGKLYAGPVWDFDYGTYNYEFNDGWIYPNKENKFLIINSLWYVGLFGNAEFRSAVKSRWNAMKSQLELDDYVKCNTDYIRKSAELDRAIWGDDIDTPNYQEKYMSTPEAISRIYSHLSRRISEFDNLISQIPD